jgi:hypothetical protein
VHAVKSLHAITPLPASTLQLPPFGQRFVESQRVNASRFGLPQLDAGVTQVPQ